MLRSKLRLRRVCSNDRRSLVELCVAAYRGRPVASASSGASPVPVLLQPSPPGGITFDVLAY